MPDELKEFGVVGVLFYLIIKELFSYLKSQKPAALDTKGFRETNHTRIAEIHSWSEVNNSLLARTDSQGLPLIYTPRESIDRLAGAVEKLADK